MTTVYIYEPNHQLAQKLSSTLKKENLSAVLCRANQLPDEEILAKDSSALVVMDA